MDEAISSTDSDRLTIAVPAQLLARIDAQVGSSFTDREDFILAAIRHYIEYLQQSQSTPDTNIG